MKCCNCDCSKQEYSLLTEQNIRCNTCVGNRPFLVIEEIISAVNSDHLVALKEQAQKLLTRLDTMRAQCKQNLVKFLQRLKERVCSYIDEVEDFSLQLRIRLNQIQKRIQELEEARKKVTSLKAGQSPSKLSIAKLYQYLCQFMSFKKYDFKASLNGVEKEMSKLHLFNQELSDHLTLKLDIPMPRSRSWKLNDLTKIQLSKGYSISSIISFRHARNLIVTCGNGNIFLLNQKLEVISQQKVHGGSIRSADYQSDQRLIVTGGEDYNLKISDDRLQTVWSSQRDICIHRIVCVLDCKQRFLVASSRGAKDNFSIKIWQPFRNHSLGYLVGHEDTIRGLAIIDSQHIVSCSEDRTIRLWSYLNQEQVAMISRRNKIQKVLFNKKYQLTVTAQHSQLNMFRTLQFKYQRGLKPFKGSKIDEMVNLDAKYFIVSSEDGRILLYQWIKMQHVVKLNTRIHLSSAWLLKEAQILLVGDRVGYLHLVKLEHH